MKKINMLYTIFTLQPSIFDSFLSNSLIARGIANHIISVYRVNWREGYGVGGYKQIDDKPFGGGSGMVLQPDPIYNSLADQNLISKLYKKPDIETKHAKTLPNNSLFYEQWVKNPIETRKVVISLTPRGYPMTQETAEWLSTNFDEIGILCGRYEGFDHRVNELVDLELSIGNYVLNGGEVAAMALIESTARLIPGFVTKSENVTHDSFSSELNYYRENEEYVVGKNRRLKTEKSKINKKIILFDDIKWMQNIQPFIEHPQYTRPEIWKNMQVPQILLEGNHKKIQNWRSNWFN
jgi:tRNA (guanine37-N1)-methyltransferase